MPDGGAESEGLRGWRETWQESLYGADGFFTRPAVPARHFRTSAHTGAGLAVPLLRLLGEVDAALGRPARLDVVDVGAGGGELLAALHLLTRATPSRWERVRLTGVDLAPRPPGLPPAVRWYDVVPRPVVGLVLATEWLDAVPLDVVRVDDDGTPRMLLVDGAGHEQPGPRPGPADAAWLARWWPLDGAVPGSRAEVGRPRDDAWSEVVAAMAAGVAVAADYGHSRDERAAGCWAAGTLTGFAAGRRVRPVPDGRRDLSAHVALDACAAAGREAGATATLQTTQRAALRSLGVGGPLPDRPTLRDLSTAEAAAELLDPGGLGGHRWLVQTVGVPLPPSLTGPRSAGGSAGRSARRLRP